MNVVTAVRSPKRGFQTPPSNSEEPRNIVPESALTPYVEVVTWRRRFYLALGAAVFALLALIFVCGVR